MHHLLKQHIRAKKKDKDRGFALYYSLTYGVIAAMTAMTMITLTLNRKEATTIQQKALQFTYAEDSVETRLKDFFSRFPYLLSSTPSEWEKSVTNPSPEDGTQLSKYYTTLCGQRDNWQQRQNQILEFAQAKQQEIGKHTFSLIDFQIVSDTESVATLRIENQQEVSADVQATINYNYSLHKPALNADLPALRLKSGNTGRIQVNGQVEIYDPTCLFPINRVKLAAPKSQKAKFIANDFSHKLNIFQIKQDLSNSNKLTLDNSYKGTTITLPLPESVPISTENRKPTYEYVISKTFHGNVSIDANSKVNGQSVVNIIHFENNVKNVHLTHQCGESTNTNCPAENLVIVGHKNSQLCLVFDELNALILATNSQVGFKSKTANQSVINFTGSLSAEKLVTIGSCRTDRLILNESLKVKDIPQKLQSVNFSVNINNISLKRQSKDNIERLVPPPEPRPQDMLPFIP